MHRRLAVAPAVVLLLASLLTACGDDSGDSSGDDSGSGSGTGSVEGVTVSGEIGEAPEVEVDEGLEVTETASETVAEGDGPEVETGQQALIHLSITNASTGKAAFSTYDERQAPDGSVAPGAAQDVTVSPGQLPAGIDEAITGQPRGSRVVTVATVEEAIGPQGAQEIGLAPDDDVVFVTDIVSVAPEEALDGPEGEESEPPEDFPTLTTDGDAITGFDFSEAPKKPSDTIQVETLIEGDGPAIPEGKPRLATMNYVGQVYGAKKPFDNSFEGEPVTFAVGNGSLIEAWDEELAGVTTGSRVIMTVPPDKGYGAQGNPSINVSGKDTMVFVIDVLGVDA